MVAWPGISASAANDGEQQLSPEDIVSRVSLTSEEKSWLGMGHKVRARVSVAPPFHMWEDGPQGISVEYLRLICEGFKIDCIFFTDMPWSEATQRIKTGDGVDLLLTIKPTPEREKFIVFTHDYLQLPWVIFSRNDSPIITKINDLIGRTLSVEKGFVMKKLLEKEYPGIKLEIVPNSKAAMEALAKGVVDAYIGNLTIGTYLINKWGYNNVKVAAPTPFGDHEQAMGVRPDWPELASLIDKFILAMTPQERAIVESRWISVRFEYGINWKVILGWAVGSLLAFFVVVLGFWLSNLRLRKEIQLRGIVETQLARRTSELERSQQLLEATGHTARVGGWELDVETNALRWTRQTFRIHELSEDQQPDLDHALDFYPDEDRDRLATAVERAMEFGEPYDLEVRFITAKGRKLWTRAICNPQLKDGKTVKLVGTFQDITERKLAEERLKQLNTELESRIYQRTQELRKPKMLLKMQIEPKASSLLTCPTN